MTVRRVSAFVLAAALTPAVACRGAAERKPPPVVGADGGAAPAVDAAPPPPPDLSFVRGTVYIAAADAGRVRAAALVPATGAWAALAAGDVDLFPSGHRWQGGLLAIATEGATEAEHVEQLAVVRGATLERLGPRTRLVRNPVVSADGRVLVVETSEHGYRDLYRVDGRGAVTRLTDNREGNFDPALSPDGAQLAFTSSRDGDAEIYRMATRGGAATRLTAFHKDDWSPLWSRDGQRLVFLSDREGLPRLFVMRADGTELRRLTDETNPDVSEDQPAFAPTGDVLGYIRGAGPTRALRVFDLAAGTARTLTPDGLADSDFAWSPDGAHVVVVRHALDGGRPGPGAITFVRVSDGAVLATDPTHQPQLLRWVP